jgi:hypothetical protein
MASTRVYRTLAANSEKKGSISVWFKLGNISGADRVIIGSYYDATYHSAMKINSDNRLNVFDYRSGFISNLTPNRVLKDPTAWYHVVFEWDTTQAAAADRNKIYINGVQETSFDTETNYSADDIPCWNRDYTLSIGARNSDQYYDGEMSHLYFIQGYAYPASTFGSSNATDGIWEINTAATVNYTGTGTNSSFLKFEDSSNLDLDSGSNTNTFTTSGTLTATKDNPSNNFCTLNPGKRSNGSTYTFSNGNTEYSTSGGAGWYQSGGTISATKGKYYYEIDVTTYSSGSSLGQYGWGAVDMQQITLDLTNPLGKLDVSGGSIVKYAPLAGFYDTGALMFSTTSSQDNQTNSYFTAVTGTCVLMIAVDLDNGRFYVGKDGTWDTTSSSDPSAGTGGYSFTPGGFNFTPVFAAYGGNTITVNFGNGYFGSTAIGSPVSAGEGLWKYTPPTNYGAFCTKNINAA